MKLTNMILLTAGIVGMSSVFAAVKVDMVKASDQIQNLDKIIAQVKKEASVSVVFPTMVPKAADKKTYYANRDDVVTKNGYSYWINVDTTPDCNGVKYCNVANLTARKDAAPEQFVDKQNKPITVTVKLAKGIKGYFTPGHAMGDYFPANIQWMNKDVLYSLTWSKDLSQGNEQAAMVDMANSAISAS